MPFTEKDIKYLQQLGKIRGYSVQAVENPKPKNKYRNQKVEFDGKIFDSIKERDRYIHLRRMVLAGEISGLFCQVEFILAPEGQQVCKYIADFVYLQDGQTIVEDVKSKITRRLPVYRLKKKLMQACLGIEIKEV